MINDFKVSSQEKYQLIDVTGTVEELVKEAGAREGLALVSVPHSTAAVILTENEEGLKKDWLAFLKKITSGFNFEHDKIDDNASSHILSGLLGQEKAISIEGGRMMLGTWQQIFLAELDGPRERTVTVKILKG
jgi:secondary thiamine-phosphate synthase enzyme